MNGKFWCYHEYEIIDKTVLEFDKEIIKELIRKYSKIEFNGNIYDKKIIYIFKCKKCKKVIKKSESL